MATAEQVQQMIDLMKAQMEQVTKLQSENAELRNAMRDANEGSHSSQTYKVKTPDRPVINAGLDDRDWALFEDTWSCYKVMLNMEHDDARKRMELRAACSDEVNKLLFEYVGPDSLKTCTESELLKHIKDVAVKSIHKEVHRMAFNKMHQNSGEPITNYVARLKAKAFLCEFNIRCIHHNPDPVIVSYAEEMVSQRLIAGLYNHEHQSKILAEAPLLPSLADKITRLLVLETTQQSVDMLNKSDKPASESAAGHSQQSGYKREKDQNKPKGSKSCRFCGFSFHPGGKTVMDRSTCPARDNNCRKCQKKGHHASVCMSSKSSAAETKHDEEQDGAQDIPAEASVSFSFGTVAQKEQPHYWLSDKPQHPE